MAQRVLIAMALSNRPRFLVADEPTSGLDVTVQRQVLEDLAGLGREEGLGLLIVSRDLGIVAHYCQRVAVLGNGQLIEDTEVRQFFANPQHPYSERLLKATALERHQTSSWSEGAGETDGAREFKEVDQR
jgi:ABC-type dipeptide/oligopeptide/nickel transport system ATPase component